MINNLAGSNSNSNIKSNPQPTKESLFDTNLQSTKEKVEDIAFAAMSKGYDLAWRFNNTLNPRMSAKDYVTFAYTSKARGANVTAPLEQQEKLVHERYDIHHPLLMMNLRTQFAQSMLARQDIHPDERAELECILQHRKNLESMEILRFNSLPSTYIQAIQKNMMALKPPQSSSDPPSNQQFVNVKGEYTSFSIRGGSSRHAISYEFRRYKDGRMTFVIHNRADGNDDKDLHGDYKVIDPETKKEFLRTSVEIEVSEEDISNGKFLHDLVLAEKNPDIKAAYQVIKDYLLRGDPPKGKIVISDEENKLINYSQEQLKVKLNASGASSSPESVEEEEARLQNIIKEQSELKAQLENALDELDKSTNEPGQNLQESQIVIRRQLQECEDKIEDALNKSERNKSLISDLADQRKKLIEQHRMEVLTTQNLADLEKIPGIHSHQEFQTCTESNFTAAEKAMAGTNTRRKLKLNSIECLTEALSKSKFPILDLVGYERDKEFLLKHSRQRTEALKMKIKTLL